MKRLLQFSLFFIFAGLLSLSASAQEKTITGKITDNKTKQPLVGASVGIKGTTTGATTDLDGKFSLKVDVTNPVTLQISYLGYDKIEKEVNSSTTTLDVALSEVIVQGKEVVISGSRVSETIQESSASIQKMSALEVREIASGDFYQGLSTMKGVDISTSSMGFQAINMRGFNTTAPVRMVQFVDGMDNQAPGLNFPVGNMVGLNDLDVQSVEVITGAASALYGPNAFQGVVSMTSKNPYDYQGLSIQLKAGSRNMADGQIRYAKVLDKKGKFAIKVTGSYFRANNWVADDSVANIYGDIETEQNLSAIVEQQQYNMELTQEERDDFIALNNYLGFNPTAYLGLGKRTINAPGYYEEDLVDPVAKSIKAGAGLHYKIKDSLELSYNYRIGSGTTTYQGANRYSINNLMFQQHKLELAGKNFNIRAYTTQENAGDSYDIVFSGIGVSRAGVANYIGEYLGAYFDSLKVLTNDFDEEAKVWMVEQASSYAESVADSLAWPAVGSFEFDSLLNDVKGNADLQKGSKFTDKSSLQHIEGQYNFDMINFMDMLAGASFRRYDPQSFGSIFSDTLINPGDTLANGSADLDAEFVDLSIVEYGGFVQLSKKVLKNKLNISASFRADKNQNFKPQFSPRFSLVYTHKNSSFRISAQQAFRIPTLQNQFILLDLGPLTLAGNLNGWDNLYTLNSVQDFRAQYDSLDANGNYIGTIDPTLLKTITLPKLKPEQVQTIEVGYRGSIGGKLYLDINGYYSVYKNFIGDIRVVRPEGSAQAGEESGEDAILTTSPDNETYTVYQLPMNATQNVSSYGGTVGLAYYFNNKYSATANYTYADLNTDNLSDDIIPGFNTPNHKINVGVKGRKVWKNLGFAANFQWVDNYEWQSTFGIGPVNSYRVLDAQLSYEFPAYYSTIRAGASNLLNEQRREVYGGPSIGRMLYVSWLFEIK